METCFLTTTKEIQNSTISRQDYGNNILGQNGLLLKFWLTTCQRRLGSIMWICWWNCILLSNRNVVGCWLLVCRTVAAASHCRCCMATLQCTSPWLLSKLFMNADFFNLTTLPTVQTWHQVTIICSEIWNLIFVDSTEECCRELVGGAVSRILFSRHCKPARKNVASASNYMETMLKNNIVWFVVQCCFIGTLQNFLIAPRI